MNKKFALSLGVLALFAACSDTDVADIDATGGTGASSGGKSSKGGTAGTLGGAGGDDSGGHGGVTPQAGMAGEGGAPVHGGGPAIEGGNAGADAGGASGAGAGGVSVAGQVGTGGINGSGGSGGAPVAVSTDTCPGAETIPNDDRTTATAYSLGSSYTGCLQNETDVDVYAFQAPADSRGGYVQVSITDVGTAGDVSMSVYTTADNGQFHNVGSNTNGGSIYMYFNVKPGAKFYIPVTKYADVDSPNPYTFKATYTQVVDTYEPNDLRTAAVPIALVTPVSAYMFAGWEYSTGIPEPEWQDWYRVELAAGNVDILLSITAADVDGNITLYDSLGGQIVSKGSNTDGESIDLKQAIASAGTYYVKIEPYQPPITMANTSTVPQYLRVPYTLTVTQ